LEFHDASALFFEVEGLENFGSTKVSPEHDARLADALDKGRPLTRVQ
jgi:hypothetical protein